MKASNVFLCCMFTALATVGLIYFGFLLAKQTVPQHISVTADMNFKDNLNQY